MVWLHPKMCHTCGAIVPLHVQRCGDGLQKATVMIITATENVSFELGNKMKGISSQAKRDHSSWELLYC